jgi:hypothetical protein
MIGRVAMTNAGVQIGSLVTFAGEARMACKTRTLALVLGLVFTALGGSLAYACDEMCPKGEFYSDSAELCVPDIPPAS